MGPEEIERVVGQITEKDVMSFAQRKLWDQDIAISAVGSIEGLLDYQRIFDRCLGRKVCAVVRCIK
jgi:mitochondrial-processing peptidase subunit beta